MVFFLVFERSENYFRFKQYKFFFEDNFTSRNSALVLTFRFKHTQFLIANVKKWGTLGSKNNSFVKLRNVETSDKLSAAKKKSNFGKIGTYFRFCLNF